MISIKNLQLGDWVTTGKGFPMQVVGTFKDVAYLDFEGNEGDVWEVEEEEIEPIPISSEILKKNGFVQKLYFYEMDFDEPEMHVESDCLLLFVEATGMTMGGKRKLGIVCQNVHELQNALRLCKIEKEIVL